MEYEEAPGELERLARDAFVSALRAAGYAGTAREVTVLLTDDKGMAELHGQYLGVFCPTDVMSFPARSEGSQSDEGRGEDRAPDIQGGPGEGYLGDIAISEETAQAQALEYGHSAEREIALLVVHGALHLIGYDDQDPGAESVMRDMEKKALELLWGGTAGSGCQGPA